MYLLGILCLVAATAALPVLPDPPTLPNSGIAAHQDSKIHTDIPNADTASAPKQDKKDNKKIKKDMLKIASVVFPPPPQLPAFDYSILKKQKADQKKKYEDLVKQKAENSKKEKESVIAEKSPKVEVPSKSETLSDPKKEFQNSEVSENNPIELKTSDSAPGADKKGNETVKNIMVKILIPSPPELPVFDYSILKKQIADKKQKNNDARKQQANKSQKEKEAGIVDLEKSVTPNPATLKDSVTVPQDSEVRGTTLSVTTDSAPVADKKDDKEVKHNKIKIAIVVVPPPPELPPFDYSNLKKQKSDHNLKSEHSKKQAAEKLKEEKEVTTLDVEKPVNVKVSLIAASLPSFVPEPQESNISANTPAGATDSTQADKKDNEEVKDNIVKIPTVVISPPPELPPFDYSNLRKQKAEPNLKSEYSVKQTTQKPKDEKEAVILDIEKPVKVEESPNPATDSIAALPVSEVRMNIPNVAHDAEEVKMNIGKIALEVIPPPPELPHLYSSILQKHKSEQKQKSDDYLKQKSEKSKKENEVFITEKPVEVKVEEPKLIEESKPMEESKPVEESKPKEELKKVPVNHSEDIPVVIKWTIPTAPFLSKLVSNYPPLTSLGLSWPLQRPSTSRRPRIIYPKFNDDGIHTN